MHGQPLTFDLFSRYAFPSNPTLSFASIIFDKLPTLGNSQDPMHLLIDFSEMLLDMWNRCLQDKYYQPIFELASLLSYTLQLNTIDIVPHIISTLLPLVQTTCFLVAVPRFNSSNGDLSNHPDVVVQQMAVEIDVTQLLSLLYLAAMGCLGTGPNPDVSLGNPQVQFWKYMTLEFILIMLSPKHPEQDFMGILSLLCTSVLTDTVGPIPNPDLTLETLGAGRPDDETPEFSARSLIDRVSYYLAEPPKWAPRRSVKGCRVRLAVLETLMAFAESPFGALQLATSNLLIPRLVTVLSWAVDSLYDMEMAFDPAQLGRGALARHGKHNDLNIAAEDSTITMTEADTPGIKKDDLLLEPLTASGATTIPFDQTDVDMPDVDVDIPAPPQSTVESSVLGSREQTGPSSADEAEIDSDAERTTLLYQIINQLTLLLYTLVTDPHTAAVADPQAKLATSAGSSALRKDYRYVLTLARLAFAEEALVLERGIGADTGERAHELLELAVTMEEGQELLELFGGP
jgi:hypothetical protein